MPRAWFYVYYAQFSDYEVRLHSINEYAEEVTITVVLDQRRASERRVYFVGNEFSKWREIEKLYGRPTRHGSSGQAEWKFFPNTSPVSQLGYSYGSLYSVDLPIQTANEMIYNSSGLGIGCLYQSIGKREHRIAFELTHRMSSREKNMYGWIEISVGESLRCVPSDLISHDANRQAPDMYAVAYDIEMVHNVDECRHSKCASLGYCHAVPSVDEPGDYINILTGVMWRVCNTPVQVATLRIVNSFGAKVSIDGYAKYSDSSSVLASGDERFIVDSDHDLVALFLRWSDSAHMLAGWNSTKFDNIQMLRVAKRDAYLSRLVDHDGEMHKLDSKDVGAFASGLRFRFARDHQMTIEGQQMGVLYKMLRPNQRSLRNAAIALNAGEKMDVSMRDMELHWREWRAGGVYNPLYEDYCLNDSMIVFRMLKDIHIEMMFAVNVASSLEQLNICHSRLPYCEPLFHRHQLERRQVYDARIKLYGNMYPMYSQTFARTYLEQFEQNRDTKKNYAGAIVSKPVAGQHANVAAVDFASLYPNNERQYSLSDGTAWGLPPEQASLVDDSKYHKIPVDLGGFKIIVCSLKDDDRVRQGCLAAYMSYCLEYRAEIKLLQGKEAKGSPRWIQLEAGQLTVKRAANGQYGITGMPQPPSGLGSRNNSNFASAIAFAAAITAIGRQYLKAAQLIVTEMGLLPIYSDTDSVYVETTMNCKELASTINSELVEMYHADDFTQAGIVARKTLGTPTTRKPILLKLAGEANYLWMSQVFKKRYICIYSWKAPCKHCGIEHNGILFKGGPGSELMRFAHETILEAYELFKRGENVHTFLSGVLKRALMGSEPSWRTQNAQPLSAYTKSTPAIHVRHANAISLSLGCATNEVEFCLVFPERYYSTKVPKALNDVSFPCLRVEFEKIYNGRALQLEVSSMTFLTDMKRAAAIQAAASAPAMEIEDDGGDDSEVDERAAKNELQYEMADVRNEHIRTVVTSAIETIKQWIARVGTLRPARLHLLPASLACKKRNFNQLFYMGIVMPRIHSHLHIDGMTRADYQIFGNGRRFAGATIAPGLGNLASAIKTSEVQICVDGSVEDEIVLASELLGVKVVRPTIRQDEILIIEALWGWYLVNSSVEFYPYAWALIDGLKKITI